MPSTIYHSTIMTSHTAPRLDSYARRFSLGWHSLIAVLVMLMLPDLMQAAVMPMDEIQQLIDAGNYRQASLELGKVQKLSRDCAAAQQYTYYNVYMLDADCQLHLHNNQKATQAATAAAVLAEAEDDQDRLARATALAVLAEKARGSNYIPRMGKDRTPIDITDSNSRIAAYPFVLADELDAFKQDKQKIKTNHDLGPVVKASQHFAGIRALEHLLTQQTTDSDKLGTEAAREVNALVTSWLNDRKHDLDRMDKEAKQPVGGQAAKRSLRSHSVPVGLSKNDIASINSYLTDCKQLPGLLEKINKGFGGGLETEGIYRTSDDLKQKAQDLLDKYAN